MMIRINWTRAGWDQGAKKLPVALPSAGDFGHEISWRVQGLLEDSKWATRKTAATDREAKQRSVLRKDFHNGRIQGPVNRRPVM
jgi:hypothetical protein